MTVSTLITFVDLAAELERVELCYRSETVPHANAVVTAPACLATRKLGPAARTTAYTAAADDVS